MALSRQYTHPLDSRIRPARWAGWNDDKRADTRARLYQGPTPENPSEAWLALTATGFRQAQPASGAQGPVERWAL